MAPFRNFKEKLAITKEFDFKAKMEIIDNKYIYIIIDKYEELN